MRLLGTPRDPDAVPLARENPEWRMAWRSLYAYEHDNAAKLYGITSP